MSQARVRPVWEEKVNVPTGWSGAVPSVADRSLSPVRFGNGHAATAKSEKPKLSLWKRLNRIGWKVQRGLERALDVVKWALLVVVGVFAFLPVPEKIRAGIERLFLRGPIKSPKLASQQDEALKDHIQEISFNMGQFRPELEKTTLGFNPKHDNVRLHAWFLPGQENKPCIVYSYGRGSNVSHHEGLLKSWMDRGYGVLIYDYPNFGRSQGRPSEEAFYKSSLAASLYAKKYLGYNVGNQVLMGNSLGSVVAATTVQHLEKLGERPKALVLASTFPSVKEAFIYNRNKFGFLGKWLNTDKISLKLDTEAALQKNTHVPVLVLQGKSDKRTPVKMIRGMLNRLGCKDDKKIKLVEMDGLRHCIRDKDFPAIVAESARFLDGVKVKEKLNATA